MRSAYQRLERLQHYHGFSLYRKTVLYGLWFFIVCLKVTGLSWLYRQCMARDACDVLFVFGNASSQARLDYLAELLEEQNVTVRQVRLYEAKFYVRAILFGLRKRIPFNLLAPVCKAQYLVGKYQPKVAVISMNSTVFPSVFRKELNDNQALLVNLAHGVGYQGIAHTSSDFDYWFVFGQSTIDGKRKNQNRVGETRAMIVGSPFIFGKNEKVFDLKTNNQSYVMIASQWTPARDDAKTALDQSALIIENFIRANHHITFVVKVHPHDNGERWLGICKNNQNVQVLDKNVELGDVLRGANLCLHMSSNVAIEAGILGIPSIAVDPYNCSEHLNLMGFLPTVKSSLELGMEFTSVMRNYSSYQKRARKYADYMLGGFESGAGVRICQHVCTLINEGFLEGAQTIPDTNFLVKEEAQ